MISEIIAYENGSLSNYDTIHLFSRLITTGMIDRLQGHYGRQAQVLIDAGYLTASGSVVPEALDKAGIEPATPAFRFARRCDITGEGMNSGWVINGGDYHIKHESAALMFAKGHGWASIQELHDHDPDNFYYTEWEELDEDGWYESPHENGTGAVYVEAN